MKASACFLAGIIADGLFDIPVLAAAGILLVCAVIMPFMHRRPVTGNAAAVCLLVSAGMFSMGAANTIRGSFEPPAGTLPGDTVVVEGTVAGACRFGFGDTVFPLRCRILYGPDAGHAAGGVVRCRLPETTLDIPEGSHVRMTGTLRRIRRPYSAKEPFNPSPLSFPVWEVRARPGDHRPVSVAVAGAHHFERLRTVLSQAFDRHDFNGRGGILRAMTIGDTSLLDPGTRGGFVRAGIAHVLAVSGLHVGILTTMLYLLMRPFPLTDTKKRVAVAVLVFVYAGICGFRPPVVRALILSLMVLGAMSVNRPRNPENSLFTAFLAIAALDPHAVFGPSVQLSFAAVWGIVAFSPPLAKRMLSPLPRSRVVRFTVNLFAVSAVAFLMTAPISAVHFGTIPLYGLAASMPAVFLAMFIVPLGFSTMLLSLGGGLLSVPAAVSARLAGWAVTMLDSVASFFSGLPKASIDAGALTASSVALLFAWLFVLSRYRAGPLFARALVYLPPGWLFIVTWLPIGTELYGADGGVRAVFLDVGQGDAAVISGFGGEGGILVDAGPRFGTYDAGRSVVLPSMHNAGVTDPVCIVLSHTHADHAGGLDTILSSYGGAALLCRESIADSLAALFGAERVIGVSAGDSISLPIGGLLVLSPPEDADARLLEGSMENNLSLVFRYAADSGSILFTGDIEPAVQRVLAAWNGRLSADVLKVPHHGAGGLDGGFLDAVSPRFAVISSGAGNRYGHPGRSTVGCLEHAGIIVVRTDRDGPAPFSFSRGNAAFD